MKFSLYFNVKKMLQIIKNSTCQKNLLTPHQSSKPPQVPSSHESTGVIRIPSSQTMRPTFNELWNILDHQLCERPCDNITTSLLYVQYIAGTAIWVENKRKAKQQWKMYINKVQLVNIKLSFVEKRKKRDLLFPSRSMIISLFVQV